MMIAMTLENVTYAVLGPQAAKTLNNLLKFQELAERVGVFAKCASAVSFNVVP
jgi:hypothetical protein